MVAGTILILSAGVVLMWTDRAESTNDDYDQKIETFFSMIAQGTYGEAVDYIYADNPWMSVKSDDVSQLRSQFVGLKQLLGPYIGHTVMHKETLTDRYVYVWYFVATERQPIAFKFQYYKPADTWLLYSFAYADDIDEWVEERGKIQFCADQ